MLFNSTYSENLKRAKVKREIGQICISDYESSPLDEIKSIEKSVPKGKKIQFYKKNFDVSRNEIEDYQPFLIFYYEEDENDTEYNNRIEALQVKDLKEFVDLLGKFNATVAKKDEIKVLYDKLKHKIRPADWKRDLIDNFFAPESVDEQVRKAYAKGFKEGRTEGKEEMKDKLKNL